MYHKQSLFILSKTNTKKQCGFMLPMALFIMVVVAVMAVVTSKRVAQISDSFLLDAISIQAFYAAETGGQFALHELFFSSTDRQTVDGVCNSMNISQTLSGPGINNCSIRVVCNCRYEDNTLCDPSNGINYDGVAGVMNSFYTVSSASSCGSGTFTAEHELEIGAGL